MKRRSFIEKNLLAGYVMFGLQNKTQKEMVVKQFLELSLDYGTYAVAIKGFKVEGKGSVSFFTNIKGNYRYFGYLPEKDGEINGVAGTFRYRERVSKTTSPGVYSNGNRTVDTETVLLEIIGQHGCCWETGQLVFPCLTIEKIGPSEGK